MVNIFHTLIRTRDLIVADVHPTEDVPLDNPVTVAHKSTFNAGANLSIGTPGPVPVSAGGNVGTSHEKAHEKPEYPTCSAGTHITSEDDLFRWVLQGKKDVTRGVTGRISHMGVTIQLPKDLSPRQVQAAFQFEFTYTSEHTRQVFPSPREYRIVTLDLGDGGQ